MNLDLQRVRIHGTPRASADFVRALEVDRAALRELGGTDEDVDVVVVAPEDGARVSQVIRELVRRDIPCEHAIVAVLPDDDPALELEALGAGASEVIPRRALEPVTFARVLARLRARRRAADGYLAQDRERRATQERYAHVFASVDEGFCIFRMLYDAEGKPVDYVFLEANAAFEGQTGLTDPVGKRATQLVPGLEPIWFERYGHVATTGEPTRFEEHAPVMGRWFSVYATRVGPAERREVALFFQDVTERRRAEQALREREEEARAARASAEAERSLLDTVLTAAPVGIIVADAAGRLLRMNPANERLWGIAPFSSSVAEYGEWKGWWAEGSERQGQRLAAEEWAMARALRGETVPGDLVEIEPFGMAGVRRTMINSAAPVRGADGRVLGAVIAQMDITARVAAEAAVRASEERFRTLADNISQLAWMANERGEIFWFNQRWYDYTGTDTESSKGHGWVAVLDPADRARVEATFERALASGEEWEDTFAMRGKDGRQRSFLTRAMPVRDERGCVVRWFGTNTDVEDRRQQEDALREAIQVRDTFLQVAAHELRTPLTALTLQLETLDWLSRRAIAEPARVAAKVEMAVRQTARLASLIEDLLDVSRITSGRLRLELTELDLAEVVREAATRLQDMAQRAGCELQVEADTVVGHWDRSRVEQVVTNLVSNAIKYGRGKPVEVRVARRDHEALLRVRDHGIGIAAGDRERIFDRFERAVSADHYGGLGLGLYITREIVHAHGGRILVESELPDEGTTFGVELPLAPRVAPEERR